MIKGSAILLAIELFLVACIDASIDRTAVDDRSPVGEVSEFQLEIIADGEVTYAEMERAAYSYIGCMEESLGIRGQVEHAGGKEDEFGYGFFDPSGGIGEKMESDEAIRCYEEYLSVVEFRWADEIGFTEAERQALFERVAECLRESGLDVADSSPKTLDFWLQREPEIYESCRNKADG